MALSALQPILIVIGTRPEAIKMIPVYYALRRKGFNVHLCSTSQHTDMIRSVFTAFGVIPDSDLNLMKPEQDLFYITTQVLTKIQEVLRALRPGLVLVQGDTTTAMATALAAFYEQIPLGHVEAGLRTHTICLPFPEEFNRRAISLTAAYHFAPTSTAVAHLLAQEIAADTIYCTGNTGIDALYAMRNKIAEQTVSISPEVYQTVERSRAQGSTLALLTLHRREVGYDGIMQVFTAIKQAVNRHAQLIVCYPYHPKPLLYNVLNQADLSQHEQVIIYPPLNYQDFVYLLSASDIVLTDSGGVQEEAVSLGKPTLILRDSTERPEGVSSGLAVLVGTEPERILYALEQLINQDSSQDNPVSHNIKELYGDGRAAERIADYIAQKLPKAPQQVTQDKKMLMKKYL